MARMSIDAKFFSDARFKVLVLELGELHQTCKGRLLDLWHHCYEHRITLMEARMINAVCEHNHMAEALLASDLGVQKEGKIYIRGVTERIEYLSRDFAEMGKKSAAARKEKFGTAQPLSNSRTGSELVPNYEFDNVRTRSEHKPNPTPTPTPTLKKTLTSSGDDVCVKFMQLWNENCRPLSTIKSLTDKRRKKIKSRLADHPDLDYWVLVVKRIAASNFCRGEVNGSTWRADFDFLLKPDTHVVTMEGRYDNRSDSEPSHSRYQTINPNEYTDD